VAAAAAQGSLVGGESLLVGGAPPTMKVHLHTDDPGRVQELAARFGSGS
jgi:dihydroxyacetone kinase-like predicted kinase